MAANVKPDGNRMPNSVCAAGLQQLSFQSPFVFVGIGKSPIPNKYTYLINLCCGTPDLFRISWKYYVEEMRPMYVKKTIELLMSLSARLTSHQ